MHSVRVLWGVIVSCFALFVVSEAFPATLVAAESNWSYLDDGSDAGSAWREPGYDDSAWASGPAELGYGDGFEATVVATGNGSTPAITTYFRHAFDVLGASEIAVLRLQLLRDDGAAVYLNGVEIHRSNLPLGTINSTTLASGAVGGGGETSFEDAWVDSSLLVEGSNLLAVEIHQAAVTSSDISFDLALTSETPALVRGPYLQLVNTSAVTLRWRTNTAMESVIRYGSAPNALSSLISDPLGKTEHEFRIDGLEPGTRYYYSVGSISTVLAGADADHFFETAPAGSPVRPVRIWVLGDSGECAVSAQGCIDAAKVRDVYLARAETAKADLVIMLGDNAYDSGTDGQTTKGVFETFGAVLRNTPVWPAPGNHEFYNGLTFSATGEGPYYEAFTLPRAAEAGGLPSGTEAYYSFEYGNVHFVSLDSHDTDRSASGAMYAWLEADLQANQSDFLIVYWHHPPYSFGSHSSDWWQETRMIQMREVFVPLLEDYGVDLVLTGHSHSLERSKLIDGHYGFSDSLLPGNVIDGGTGDPATGSGYEKDSEGPGAHEGAVYAVIGSSSKNSGGLTRHPVMAFVSNYEGAMLIEISGQEMDATIVDANGTDRDKFRITKAVPEPEQALLSLAAVLAVLRVKLKSGRGRARA
jgi:hypothetical protein